VNKKSGDWEIQSREFKEIKRKLVLSLTNMGQPRITVLDGNFENRSELLLHHAHDGVDLQGDWARDTLTSLYGIWGRPVALATKNDNKGVLIRFDGKSHTEKASNLVNEIP
jgi:stage V sporulation protein R